MKRDKIARTLALQSDSGLKDITHKYANDFLFPTPAYWAGQGINGGTSGSTGSIVMHQGVVNYLSSTSANSGYRMNGTNYWCYLKGGEKTTLIFKTSTTVTGVTRRFGFLDCSDYNDATHGVYGEIIDGILKGKTSTNGIRSQTSTTYTLIPDTWYRFVLEVNGNNTQITYKLYADNSHTLLWQDSLTTNIPPSSIRCGGSQDICTYSGTTAITIGYLDYIEIVVPDWRIIN